MANAIAEGVTAQQLMAPADNVTGLLPEYDYQTFYQPDWPDMGDVAAAIHELRDTEMVTTFQHVDELHDELTAIATGASEQLIGMTGRCADRLKISRRMRSMRDLGRVTIDLARGVLRERNIVQSAGEYLHISREFNYAKPRTDEAELVTERDVEMIAGSETEPVTITAGEYVPSWQGDSVNGQAKNNRKPEPSNMVSVALQSRDVASKQTELSGEHVPTAHELLLLPYEIGMLREDPETGRLYSLSADMLWVGVRTNSPDSPQVQLASMIANPVGVKLGPGTTPELIASLNTKLNPDNIPGRLTFMIRMGLDNVEDMEATISAIAQHAPNSIIMYDPHGSTEKIDGVKVRTVTRVIDEIKTLAAICHKYKLPLHGALLETMPDNNRQECLNYPGEMPPIELDKPDVDPLFNLNQFGYIYTEVAPVLGKSALRAAMAA